MAGVKNTQAEVGLIATLIQHPEFILFEPRLKDEYFTEPANKVLFDIIKELYIAGVKSIDEFSLSAKINNSTEYISATKGLDLEELVNNSIFVAREKPGEYRILAKDVMDFARTRKFISTCQTYAMQGRTEGVDIIKLQNQMYDELSKISDEFTEGEQEALIGEKIDDIYKEIVRRAKEEGGLLSKFPSLNEFVTYDKGELVIFSAKRKVGKSVLLLNEAVDKAKQGKNILYLDSEMSDTGWTQRLLALMSGVSIRKIKDQTFDNNEEEQKVLNAIEEIKKLPIVHINNPAWTMEQLEMTIKNWNQRLGLDLVFMDYIKAPDTDDAYVELGKITNFFKNKIAVGLNLSVVAAAQSNRGGDTGESYRIEQFCSTLVKLVEKSPEEMAQQDKECGQYKLFVALNRNGKNHGDIESDYIDVDFTGATMTMTEGKKHETQDFPF